MIIIPNNSIIEQDTKHNTLNTLMQISIPYIIIVSIIGICGNILTIIMLSKRSISKNFNNCTLIALALTDLLFNFTLASRCINDITQSNSEQLCRLLAFLSHLAELLSACFTAQFTAQRFVAVRFPLSVFIEKKIHLIHYFIVSILIASGIIYCLALVQNNVYDYCHEELELKWFLSDALLSFLIPFTIISILNILIICHLKKGFQNNQQFRFRKRQQQQFEIVPLNYRKKSSLSYDLTSNIHYQSKIYENINISNSKGTHTNGDLHLTNERVRSVDLLHRSSLAHSKSQSYRVTRMLILVSTCFLLLNAPSHICTIGLKIYTLKQTILIDNSHDYVKTHNHSLTTLSNNIDFVYMTKYSSSNQIDMNDNLKWMDLFYIIVIVTQHISYASYSINFFLYSFCGIKLRHELIRCISQKRRPVTLSRSVTVQNTV